MKIYYFTRSDLLISYNYSDMSHVNVFDLSSKYSINQYHYFNNQDLRIKQLILLFNITRALSNLKSLLSHYLDQQ